MKATRGQNCQNLSDDFKWMTRAKNTLKEKCSNKYVEILVKKIVVGNFVILVLIFFEAEIKKFFNKSSLKLAFSSNEIEVINIQEHVVSL